MVGVEALYMNGQPLEWVRPVAYDSFMGRNIELIVDVMSVLRPGSNPVAFQIPGPDGLVDLDGYELQPASE